MHLTLYIFVDIEIFFAKIKFYFFKKLSSVVNYKKTPYIFLK